MPSPDPVSADPACSRLTPCVGVCRLGADGRCEGCLRSGEEIARWPRMGEGERLRYMRELLPARRGGA